MNEYVLKLYDLISEKNPSFSRDINVNDFVNTITTNDEYASQVYGYISEIEPRFATSITQDDFMSALKKKDAAVANSTESVYQPEAEDTGSELQYRDKSQLLKDPNIKLAYDQGKITDEELDRYAENKNYEHLPSFGTDIASIKNFLSKIPNLMSPAGALDFEIKKIIDENKPKKKSDEEIFDLVSKYTTPQEYEEEIQELSVVNPYVGKGTGYLDQIFDKSELLAVGINPKDMDGFLEENGWYELYDKRLKSGVYNDGFLSYARDEQLALELDKKRMLDAYIGDKAERSKLLKTRMHQKVTGVHPDLDGTEIRPSVNLNPSAYREFYNRNFSTIIEEEKKAEQEQIRNYAKKITGQKNPLEYISELGSSFLKGAQSRVSDLASYSLDVLPFLDGAAERERSTKEQAEFKESLSRIEYTSARGRLSEVNGVKYIVSDDGQIYDTNSKTRVTNILEEDAKKKIIDSAQDIVVSDRSSYGLALEGASVVGDLGIQIAEQAAITKFLNAGRMNLALKNLGDKGKVASKGFFNKFSAGNAAYKPTFSADVANAMISQGVLGMIQGYEGTLKAARQAGISEEEALDLASDASKEMTALYAVTALLNPRTSQVNAIIGEKNILKRAVESYAKLGKEGSRKVFLRESFDVLRAFGVEGTKELIQENIQQASENFVVNPEINKAAGKNILKDTMTLDEFIDVSILSFAAGGLSGSAGSISGMVRNRGTVDDLKAISLLSKDFEKSKTIIEKYAKLGIFSEESAERMIMDIEAFSKAQGMIPGDLTEDQIAQIIPSISKIVNSQNQKKNLDPAFHDDINFVIEQERGKIKKILQGEINQGVDPQSIIQTEDTFTHQTSSEEAIRAWANSGEIVGRNEALADFDETVPKTLTEKATKVGFNRQSPNFQRGGLYSGQVNKGVKFVVTTKGDGKFIPSREFMNVESFESSDGIGTLKPDARNLDNFELYKVNEDGTLTKQDWADYRTTKQSKKPSTSIKTGGILDVENEEIFELEDGTLVRAVTLKFGDKVYQTADENGILSSQTVNTTDPRNNMSSTDFIRSEYGELKVEEPLDLFNQPEFLRRPKLNPQEEIVTVGKKKYSVFRDRNGEVTGIFNEKGDEISQYRTVKTKARTERQLNPNYVEGKRQKGVTKYVKVDIPAGTKEVINPKFAEILSKGFGVKTKSEVDKKREEDFVQVLNAVENISDAMTLAMAYLARGNKLNKANVMAETGMSAGETMWVSGKNKTLTTEGDPTIEAAAEIIFGGLSPEVQSSVSDMDIRNALIEVIRSYSSTKDLKDVLIEQNLETEEEQELDQSFSPEEKAFMDAVNDEIEALESMTDEEVMAYYQEQFEKQLESLTDEEYAKLVEGRQETETTEDEGDAEVSEQPTEKEELEKEPAVEEEETPTPQYLSDETLAEIEELQNDLDSFNATNSRVIKDQTDDEIEREIDDARREMYRVQSQMGRAKDVQEAIKAYEEAKAVYDELVDYQKFRRSYFYINGDLMDVIEYFKKDSQYEHRAEFIKDPRLALIAEHESSADFYEAEGPYQKLESAKRFRELAEDVREDIKRFPLKKNNLVSSKDVQQDTEEKQKEELAQVDRIAAQQTEIDFASPEPEIQEEKKVENKKVQEIQEEIDTLESEVELYEIQAENLLEEIEIEKGNLKEELARIDAEAKEVRASKRPAAEKREAIEDLKYQKEDAREEHKSLVDQYKQEAKEARRDAKKASNRIKKLKDKLVTLGVPKEKRSDERVDNDDKTKGRIRMMVANVRASLRKMIPELQFYTFESTEKYEAAIKQLGLEVQKGAPAFYLDATKAIYIDLSKATPAEVVHEAFHAAFGHFFALKSDVRQLTGEMMQSLKRVIPKELSNKLDKFIQQYDDIDQSEEFITGFTEFLADNYETFKPRPRGIISTWLNRIGKMLGFQSFTDEDVVNLLRSLSRSMVRGESLSEADFGFIASRAEKKNRNIAKGSIKATVFNSLDQPNITEAMIRRWAESRGYSISEINHYIKEYNEQKKLEAQKEDGVFIPQEGFNFKNLKSKLEKSIYRSYLSAKGFLPKSARDAAEAMRGMIQKNLKQAKLNVLDLERAIEAHEGNKEELMNAVRDYMNGDNQVQLPENVREIVFEMRAHIDALSQLFIDLGMHTNEGHKKAIKDNLGSYMNRSYKIFDDADYKPTEEVLERAKNHFRVKLWKNATKIADETSNDFLEVLEDMVEKEVFKILSKDVSSSYIATANDKTIKTALIQKKKDIPAPIRALMGEYSDPVVRYYRTISNLAGLTEAQKFLNSIKEAGLGVYLFEEKSPNNPNYTTKIAADGSKVYNPLGGLYTTKEIAEALRGIDEIVLNEETLNQALQYWLKAVGMVKYSKTILSVGTHAKNVAGNLVFMFANGYLDPKAFFAAADIIKNDLTNGGNKEFRSKMQEYIEVGIISQEVSIQEVRNMLRSGDSFEEMLLNRHKDHGHTARTQRYFERVKKGGKFAEALYQSEDDLFKIISFEMEKKRYAKAKYAKEFDELTQAEKNDVVKIAAENTKNILPNYSRIGKLGKMLRVLPVATFISFEMESWRTAYNTATLAMKELKDPNTRDIGARRMTGIIATRALMAMIYGTIGSLGFGDDDEEDEKEIVRAARLFLPYYAKNASIVIEDLGSEGFRYRNISASDPWGSSEEVVNAVFSGRPPMESFKNAFFQAISPFTSKDILAGAAFDIIGSFYDDYPDKIFDESNTADEIVAAAMERIWKAAEPGTLTSARKIIDTYKKDEDVSNEIIGQVTGLKAHDVDFRKQMTFNMLSIRKREEAVRKRWQSSYYQLRDKKITEEEREEIYNSVNVAQKKIYGEAIEMYRAALILGADKKVLIEAMNNARIPKKIIGGIIRGEIKDMPRGR